MCVLSTYYVCIMCVLCVYYDSMAAENDTTYYISITNVLCMYYQLMMLQNRFNAISQISDGDPSHTFLGS